MANLYDLKQFKCKTCGEPLEIEKAKDGVIICNYCESRFTLPKDTADQKVLNFLFQGEHDLDTGKFNDAYEAFNKAAELDKTEPEAYWGMALAEFKIQYLKDEVNNRLQPICHEVSDKDFTDGANYLRAYKYATEAQRAEYERKGKEINYIKDEFLKLKQTGLDYDCFICVKVSDENGGKTADSDFAHKIYRMLKNNSYEPFYSEAVLKTQTGADYEAHVLYALATSETMLVICFDEGYLRTKWVKNEYTRFLKLVNDKEKESDSIALVFGDRPIEKLPGKNGKIQGIDSKELDCSHRILQFVESHTPEARKRRAELALARDNENEAQRKKFAEQEERLRQLEELLKAQQNATGQVEDEKDKEGAEELAQSARDFEIDGCHLKKYKGNSTEAVIPHKVWVIDDNAFKECSKLTSITIPNSVVSIGDGAFSGCSGLTSITLPDSITNIGESVFSDCSGLTSITIPNSVTSIGESAFAGCSGLTSITIPNSVVSIGESAFYGCSRLTSITIPNSVTDIGESAFAGCSGLTSVTIPNSVTSIAGWTFDGCSELNSIAFPNRVISIGVDAFGNCRGLKSITLPSSVKSVATEAFYRCTGLTSVVIPESVTDMSFMTFCGCNNLTIYCRVEEKPECWDRDWNKKGNKLLSGRHKVVWGYKGK